MFAHACLILWQKVLICAPGLAFPMHYILQTPGTVSLLTSRGWSNEWLLCQSGSVQHQAQATLGQNVLDEQLAGLCLVVRLATHPSNPPKFQFGDQLHLKTTRGLAISAMVKRWLWATATVSAALAVHGALRGHLRRAAAAALTAVLLATATRQHSRGTTVTSGGRPARYPKQYVARTGPDLICWFRLQDPDQTFKMTGEREDRELLDNNLIERMVSWNDEISYISDCCCLTNECHPFQIWLMLQGSLNGCNTCWVDVCGLKWQSDWWFQRPLLYAPTSWEI